MANVGKTRVALHKIKRVFHDEEMKIYNQTERASVKLAEEVIKESRKYVPVKTGYLYNSARVWKPRVVKGRKVSVNFGYTAPYALAVHERTIPYLSIALQQVDPGGLFTREVAKGQSKRQVRTGVRIQM